MVTYPQPYTLFSNPFRKAPKPPTAAEIAVMQLEEARIELLEQQRAKEHHTAMVQKLEARINRLTRATQQIAA